MGLCLPDPCEGPDTRGQYEQPGSRQETLGRETEGLKGRWKQSAAYGGAGGERVTSMALLLALP